ncbi:chromate transporter [Intestinimonas butyriciproducens]|uniref:chromate transporter n=1 Tax=Intestinimonas butyriciproducens TaxID=1297617 RepID=UPI0019567BDA|nr:chromate transporter [Intestinimonas butyriciproducens]MBM6919091.1 chromate transporter [Intestinimonas butyriciproducens]
MKKDLKFFWTLFISTFTLSAFTFGGGYVIVPLMRKKFVETLGWIDEEEMLDLIAIAQSAPGPIAVNSSIIIGYRLAGIPGALVTTFGTVLPPMVILSAISQFYTAFRDNVVVSLVLKGMGIGVAAVIVDVVYTMAKGVVKTKDALWIIVMCVALVVSLFTSVNVVFVILACGVIGAINVIAQDKKTGKGGKAA